MSITEIKTALNAIINGTNDSNLLKEIYASISKVIKREKTATVKLSVAEKKATDKALLSVKKERFRAMKR